MTQAALFSATSEITFANRWDHVLARFAYRRSDHRVQPGLYALGEPDAQSSVFVTANYTLSFDALRGALDDIDAYILVLDTKGVNVWCAAGKGTFGTEELISRIKSSGLSDIVSHRNLILPQLGATGVSAHKVKQATGFNVEYGPILARDLPEYLKTHTATAEMRRMPFTLLDRLVLVPVELVTTFLPFLGGSLAAYLTGGWFYVLWLLVAWLTGAAFFLLLLPLMPTREFTTKGLILGGLTAIPFLAWQFARAEITFFQNLLSAVPMALITTALVGYMGLNATGTTPVTSWTSVKREIKRYLPVLAGMAGTGTVLIILRLLGVGG